jgi:GMP synthase (glutamine-hydrolysing)
MKTFLIIKAGISFVEIINEIGDFDIFTIDAFPNKPQNVKVLNAYELPDYPNVEDLYGVVITGAHENTTDNTTWMMNLKEWIKNVSVSDIPMLGICFGHQIIAEALGGTVGFNKQGGEFGVVDVNINNNTSCFVQLPSKINVFASHYQSVLELPNGATSIAYNTIEPNHFVHYCNNVWGLQFHPEFNEFIIKIHQQKNNKPQILKENQLYKKAENIGTIILESFYNKCKKNSR